MCIYLPACINLKQKHLRCKQVQGQSEAVANLSTKKFDIKLRPRSLEYNDIMLTTDIVA